MEYISSEHKERLGDKYIGEGTIVTDLETNVKWKIRDIKKDGFEMEEVKVIGEGKECKMPFDEFVNNFEKGKISVSGYNINNTQDIVVLNQLIDKIKSCHKIEGMEGQIMSLEIEEVDLKRKGGKAGKASYSKDGYVKQVKNMYGKMMKTVETVHGQRFQYDSKDKRYKDTATGEYLKKDAVDNLLFKTVIKNQYEGLKPGDIWESWNRPQRIHFLKDHSWSLDVAPLSYSELPESIQGAIASHKFSGQYAKGGSPKKQNKNKEIEEVAERLIDREILANQTALVTKLLENETISVDDIQNMYVYRFKNLDGTEIILGENGLEQYKKKINDKIDKTKDEEEQKKLEAHLEEIDQLDTEAQDPLEYYLISDWLKEKLLDMDEIIIDADYGTWWGRTTSGQLIIADGLFQKIAKNIQSKRDGGRAQYYRKEGGSAENKGYQGWKNYETWNIKLWIDNDQSSNSYWDERAEEAWNNAKKDKLFTKAENARLALSDELKDYFEENNPLSDTASTYSDLLNGALSEVDWREIADSLLEEKIKYEGGSAGKKDDFLYPVGTPQKYQVGGRKKLYSYQNPDVAATVTKHRVDDFGDEGIMHYYKLSLPDEGGYTKSSKWISERSLSETPIPKDKRDEGGSAGKNDDEKSSSSEPRRTEEFRYIKLTPVKGGLEISLTDEGREFVKEGLKERKADVFIFPELFDDVVGNSSYQFHPDLGEAGFGMTSAPGVTVGYMPSEDVVGEWEAEDKDEAKAYYFDSYMTKDMVEEMLEDGKVVMTEAEADKAKRGGRADITKNYYRFRQKSPRNVTECAIPKWATKVAESVKKGAKITTCKKDGKWMIQSILIPKDGVKMSEARKMADEIKEKMTRKKKALGGYADDAKCEDITKTINGLKELRDASTDPQEKIKYQNMINDLSV